MDIYYVVKALIQKDDEILLVKRSKNDVHSPGRWSTPGGGVEQNESAIQALHREVREEVDLVISPLKVIGTKHFIGDDTKSTIVVTYVLCEYISGNVVLNEEHDEFRWIREIPKDISLPYSLKISLKRFLKK